MGTFSAVGGLEQMGGWCVALQGNCPLQFYSDVCKAMWKAAGVRDVQRPTVCTTPVFICWPLPYFWR